MTTSGIGRARGPESPRRQCCALPAGRAAAYQATLTQCKLSRCTGCAHARDRRMRAPPPRLDVIMCGRRRVIMGMSVALRGLVLRASARRRWAGCHTTSLQRHRWVIRRAGSVERPAGRCAPWRQVRRPPKESRHGSASPVSTRQLIWSPYGSMVVRVDHWRGRGSRERVTCRIPDRRCEAALRRRDGMPGSVLTQSACVSSLCGRRSTCEPLVTITPW